MFGIRHTIIRHDNAERTSNPVVDRHIVVAQHAQHKYRGRAHNSRWRIHIAAYRW